MVGIFHGELLVITRWYMTKYTKWSFILPPGPRGLARPPHISMSLPYGKTMEKPWNIWKNYGTHVFVQWKCWENHVCPLTFLKTLENIATDILSHVLLSVSSNKLPKNQSSDYCDSWAFFSNSPWTFQRMEQLRGRLTASYETLKTRQD